MGKREITMNKPVYFGQAVLDLSKMLMYEFYYDYMRLKYVRKAKLCYMGTDSFVYRDIAKDVENKFNTSGYSKDENRPMPIGKNKKVNGLMKDELGQKIMTKFVALRANKYVCT